MIPHIRVSLVLCACLAVYGYGLYTFNKEHLHETQNIPLLSPFTTKGTSTFTTKNGEQPTYPSGYSTGIIEFLHDLPRATYTFESAPHTFYPSQPDYWYGTAWLAAWVLALGILITCCCGVPCCIGGATNCCGRISFDKNRGVEILLKILMVLTLVVTLGVLVVAIVANVEANNEFIPIVEIPDQLLNGMSEKLNTIVTEANNQSIPVPDEITTAQATINGIKTLFDQVIPEVVDNIIDGVYEARGYAFLLSFILGIIICIAGVVCVFLLRGNTFTIWLGFLFISFFCLVLIVAPLLMVNTVVADVCIDSNDILIRPITDNTTRDLTIYYLFCPEGYTPDLEFVDQLVNDTETVLEELEEGRQEALEETDTELVAEYDERIEQTEDLLTLEQSLYECNATSADYNGFVEEICQESLKWNWVLMWLIFGALLFQMFSMCCGFSAIFLLPKQNAYYVLE